MVTNDTSMESPNKMLLKSGLKLGMVSQLGCHALVNIKSSTFSNIGLMVHRVKIDPVSDLQSIGIALGFLNRYVILSYLKGLRNGSWSKLKCEKKHPL